MIIDDFQYLSKMNSIQKKRDNLELCMKLQWADKRTAPVLRAKLDQEETELKATLANIREEQRQTKMVRRLF